MHPYLGNIAANDKIWFPFNTESGGAPAPFDDSPVVVGYRDGVASPITAGISITVDFDGLIGTHLVTVDTSVAGYGAAHDFIMALLSGPVGGLPRDGLVLGEFSIENRFSGGSGGGTTAQDIWTYGSRTLTTVD